VKICSDVLGMVSRFSFVRAVLSSLHEIWGSCVDYKEHPAFDAVWSGRPMSTFQKNLLPQSSVQKSHTEDGDSHSFCSVSYDRSIASPKASSPQNAI
jgi:hypothetical protein